MYETVPRKVSPGYAAKVTDGRLVECHRRDLGLIDVGRNPDRGEIRHFIQCRAWFHIFSRQGLSLQNDSGGRGIDRDHRLRFTSTFQRGYLRIGHIP